MGCAACPLPVHVAVTLGCHKHSSTSMVTEIQPLETTNTTLPERSPVSARSDVIYGFFSTMKTHVPPEKELYTYLVCFLSYFSCIQLPNIGML